jgi:hypothetical protein
MMSTTINNPFITKSPPPSLVKSVDVTTTTEEVEISTTTIINPTISSSSSTQNITISSSILTSERTTDPTPTLAKIEQKMEITKKTDDDDDYSDYNEETIDPLIPLNETDDESETTKQRKRRATEQEKEKFWGKLTPGACLRGCTRGFTAFVIVSSIINCLGISARIGNLLVNYRCVSKQDKSVTQGLILMLISLFALIPGPIMYGKIIDTTCLVWTEQCSGLRGNCQLYDQKKFRYYINLTAFVLTTIGVFFDFLVWKHGRNLDLYGEREEEMLKKQRKLNWNDKEIQEN